MNLSATIVRPAPQSPVEHAICVLEYVRDDQTAALAKRRGGADVAPR